MIMAIFSVLMAAVTAGLTRTAKRNAAGNLVTGSESDALDLGEWDNSEAPRPVYHSRYGGKSQATPEDLPVFYDVAFRGTQGDILVVQVQPDTAFTADQGDNVLTRIQVKEFIYDSSGRLVASHDRTLRNRHRITPPGGAGQIHDLGLEDGGSIRANVWNDYLRFAPAANAEWVLKGRQRTDVHNNA